VSAPLFIRTPICAAANVPTMNDFDDYTKLFEASAPTLIEKVRWEAAPVLGGALIEDTITESAIEIALKDSFDNVYRILSEYHPEFSTATNKHFPYGEIRLDLVLAPGWSLMVAHHFQADTSPDPTDLDVSFVVEGGELG